MNPSLTMVSEGRKFMWDGRLFDTQGESLREAEAYQKENFETRTLEQEGKFLVYTRRVVKQPVATGS